MSSKDCKHHGGGKRRKLCRRIFSGILIFLFIVLVTVLLIWAILKPSKPTFLLQDVTVYAFNASTPNILTSNFLVTLYSRNPNDNIGIYYDQLYVYASYRNQQITVRTTIPPTYQGHKQVNVWSPFISGTDVPVAPYNSVTLSQDQSNGVVSLNVKLEGKVRWKVGAFISGHYHIHVQCPAYIPFGSTANGVTVGANAVKYQLVQECGVGV